METDRGGYKTSQTPSTSTSSPVISFLHVLKVNVGPGCLSLPYAFSLLPNYAVVLGAITIGLCTGFSSLLLPKLVDGTGGSTYTDIGAVYDTVNGVRYGERTVNWSILMQQLSVCTVYFSFVR